LTDFLDDFLREGIAVLLADITTSDWGVYEQPMQQIVDGVDAATDAALATGVIDPARLGILGESYGGYMVNAVIAHTDRFKAAASVAGLSDLFGNYMGTASDGSSYYELGQGRMAAPLWQEPQRYVENSPIVHWDRVRTPVLFVHGLADNTVPLAFGREGFKGLLRLDRDAIFAVYNRMGHKAQAEQLQRIRGWFREHLLAAPPITQIAEQASFFLGGDAGGEVSTAPAAPDRNSAPASSEPR
ncbi:MAG: alpha/beta hydrolase family protein, partial [Steroidobacteraceae bacterium]